MQPPRAEIILDLGIGDGRDAGIQRLDALPGDIIGDHAIVLRKKHRIGQTDITDAGNRDIDHGDPVDAR